MRGCRRRFAVPDPAGRALLDAAFEELGDSLIVTTEMVLTEALNDFARRGDSLQRAAVECWVERLDFSTLERVNASHVSERLRARHGDTVWKLRFKDEDGQGPWLYVYLLLEFQSTPYPFMPVRMLGATWPACWRT